MSTLFLIILSILSSLGPLSFANNVHVNNPCRSYCGNITIDYPFALQYGCGHPGFRDLLFCMNDVLMFHISSGSYRVLEIDYAYQSVTIHEPHLSTCDTLVLGGKGNGFAVEQWRSPYFNPTADNVFMLIGCSAQSSLFQGFPGKHLPCRNVSGMGCEEYYGCPAWSLAGRGQMGSMFGSGPPECCAVAFEAIRAINLSKLDCEGYSSAYSLAPLRVDGPSEWSFGIRVKYSVQGNEFCRACEATGGTCGYGSNGIRQLCMCGDMNSTSNCDSVTSATDRRRGHGLVTVLTAQTRSLLSTSSPPEQGKSSHEFPYNIHAMTIDDLVKGSASSLFDFFISTVVLKSTPNLLFNPNAFHGPRKHTRMTMMHFL